MNVDDSIVVYITAGNEIEAERIANALVEKRLAACATLISPVKSIYRWKDNIEKEREILIIAKTKSRLFESLKTEVLSIHSYEVPEIISIPIGKGHGAYMDWIDENTGSKNE
ncbi:MAG TPA: divalent-cation tolerance protein CutA [bacterium]|nr:divalent-cation tolerance protein CutA [bacterium]